MAEPTFEPCFPSWYSPTEEEHKDFEHGNLSENTLEKIILSGFDQIANSFEDYQNRDPQINMSIMILKCLYSGKVAVIEAGTGIGKSFAYIVASLAFSYLTGGRVLFTTETKNLQMQIFQKDIHFIRSVLSNDLRFELCLGSGNYLCQLRYQETFDSGSFRDTIKPKEINQFHEWVGRVQKEKKAGTVYELEPNPNPHFWSMVNRDSDGCPGKKCSFYEGCNYFRVKYSWTKARILITNHHLLLYHIQNEKKVLPEYASVVVDEAHGFLKTAYSIFSMSFHTHQLSEYKKSFDKFFLSNKKLQVDLSKRLSHLWGQLETAWNSFFSYWEDELNMAYEQNNMKIIQKSITFDMKIPKNCIFEIRANLQENFTDDPNNNLLNYVNSFDKFLGRAFQFFDAFQKMDFEAAVYWASKEKEKFYLHTCSIQLGDHLKELFTEQQIWTSATIGYWSKTTPPSTKEEAIENGYFNSFIQNIFPPQMQKGTILKNIFKSGFDFKQQVLLYLPRNLEVPPWDSPETEKETYRDHLMEQIIELVELSKGGALVLFTSNWMLEYASDVLEEALNFPVFSQLRLGAQKAIEEFHSCSEAILLGTNSFWQGIDIPGSRLRMLIITKLMFTPPEDPIYKARDTLFKKTNRNAFYELALPYANTMLRQGFGRLIRKETDKGVIAILDSRILSKSYGKNLLMNLPRASVVYDQEKLAQEVKNKLIFS